MSVPKASIDVHFETPPHPQSPRSKLEEQFKDAQITFDKTIDGHYRHGVTGYKRVGALFLTWEKDDLQCRETEVNALRELFQRDFQFETDYFEIPAERWQTSLLRKVSDFIYHYDSRDCLAIIYYGGHGYLGTETGSLKLSAKYEPDGKNPNGDETLFFNDITTCLRLPACDQILIVDCCYSATAFAPEPIGKQKFELLTSAGAHNQVPGPGQPGSFTSALVDVLRKNLIANPRGFCTSQLYRDLFHSIPKDTKTKPMLFDQSRHSYGKIWLRPQELVSSREPSNRMEGRYLNLNLQLDEEPNNVVMNELALALQYLPHVVKVRFVSLYAPKHQIESFMRSVYLAKKLRPLVRRLHARVKLRKLTEMAQNEKTIQPSASFLDLLFKPISHPIYDWSSARRQEEVSSSGPRVNSYVWSPALAEPSSTTQTVSNRLFSIDYIINVPNYVALKSIFRHGHANVAGYLSRLIGSTTTLKFLSPISHSHISMTGHLSSVMSSATTLSFRSPTHLLKLAMSIESPTSNTQIVPKNYLKNIFRGDNAWHAIMWVAVWYVMFSICIDKKE